MNIATIQGDQICKTKAEIIEIMKKGAALPKEEMRYGSVVTTRNILVSIYS